jgi:hypothetical protein
MPRILRLVISAISSQSAENWRCWQPINYCNFNTGLHVLLVTAVLFIPLAYWLLTLLLPANSMYLACNWLLAVLNILTTCDVIYNCTTAGILIIPARKIVR